MWQWLVPAVLLLVYGGAAARDAANDRSPRAPTSEWWRRKPPLAWWAHRRSPRERMRGHVRLKGRPVKK